MKYSSAVSNVMETKNQTTEEKIKKLSEILINFPERHLEINLLKQKLVQAELSLDLTKTLQQITAEEMEHLSSIDSNLALEIWKDIYPVNEAEFERVYQKNTEFLNEFPYYYNSEKMDSVNIKPLFISDDFIAVVMNGKIITMRYQKKEADAPGQLFFIGNNVFLACLKEFRLLFPNSLVIPNHRTPIYFYFSAKDVLAVLLFSAEFADVVKDSGIVIICGEEMFDKVFNDPQTKLPNNLISTIQYHYEKIKQIYQDREERQKNNLAKIRAYYQENCKEINQRVKTKKIKLLFYASIHTTALQYHTKAFYLTAKKLGYEAEFVIEKHFINDAYYDYCNRVASFKPDVIFIIDHFRSSFLRDVPGVYAVTWIQDAMPHLLEPENIKKLTNYDLILNLLFSWDYLLNLYQGKNMIDAPIPGNDITYFSRVLSAEDYQKYSCDICIVTHHTDYLKVIEDLPVSEELRQTLIEIASEYYSQAQRGEFIYGFDNTQAYLQEKFEDKFKVKNSAELDMLIEYATGVFYPKLLGVIYRSVIIEWLLSADLTNIKIWGNGWQHTKFKEYAMGAAENGETLSKIFQCAKIVVASNGNCTTTSRIFETLLSGGFYLSNTIPAGCDTGDVFKLFQKDEELPAFTGKEDLIQKVKFYLANEAARKELAARGRQKILANLTYTHLFQNMADKLAQMAQENIAAEDIM